MSTVYYARRPLSAAEQQRLNKLERRTKRISRDDRRYFERNPDRRHRVRRAAKVEVEALAIARGRPLELSPDVRMFTAIRRVTEDHRIRLFVPLTMNGTVDLDEDASAAVFEVAADRTTKESA